MAGNYKTPGVYVEEVSIFPPSVAEVSTAVPAFIGYTEKGPNADEVPIVERISTLLEYQEKFGGPLPTAFTTEVNNDGKVTVTKNAGQRNFLMYYCLSMYFKNGGGSCYIVSVGRYTETLSKDNFLTGLEMLKSHDEPTLILLTDAVNLSASHYFEVCQQALIQCSDLMDRFAIFDLPAGGNSLKDFRDGIGNDNLRYGAAYYPSLQTSLNYSYEESQVTVNWPPAFNTHDDGLQVTYGGSEQAPELQITIGGERDVVFGATAHRLTIQLKQSIPAKKVASAWDLWKGESDTQGFEITPLGNGSENVTVGTHQLLRPQPHRISNSGLGIDYAGMNTSPQFTIEQGTGDLDFDVSGGSLTIKNVPEDGVEARDILTAWKKWKDEEDSDPAGFELSETGPSSDKLKPQAATGIPATPFTMKSISKIYTLVYNQIKVQLSEQSVVLPPSATMAGVYARVDRERGVWKAPANVGLAAVIGPTKIITHDEQGLMNVDPNTGKSINAIRSFPGKGTLVWGARTLDGNSNEWRYVNVRRLFIMIEESTKKATDFAVFEANDATTWLKVKGMIESFLYGLWERGALAGPTPDSAYFVNVGLGKTMTTDDVLNGRMIVEIGVAAVRPAEFIILRFSHKLQEA